MQLPATVEHEGIYEDLMNNFNVLYKIGGAAFSTLKVVQWMLNTDECVTTLFLCLGNDDFSRLYIEEFKHYNVNGRYYVEDKHIGKCAVLINGVNRALVSKLDHAKNFKGECIDLPENWKLIQEAEFYYVCGYFLGVSIDSVITIARYASENNKHFIYNLSSPYACRRDKHIVDEIISRTDVLFGNDNEALTLAEVYGYQSDNLEDVVKWMQALPKVNKTRERVVVITRGPHDTIVATVEGITTHPVIPVDEKDIIDTCCAGDAFAGGFLSQFIQGKPLKDCIRAAHYTASIAIKGYGVTLPEKPEFI